MPRLTWPAEAEKCLIEMWHKELTSEQGKMKTKQEKVESVKKLMDERAKENEWDLDLTADQLINKIDSLSKKAKKTYDKF